MERLITQLRTAGILKSERVIEAFQAVPRVDFVDYYFKSLATVDEPLPIGSGQTISQPLTVAFMLELLNAQEGHSVLEIGSGTGWVSALLAHIVGPTGRVVGVEIIQSLADAARARLRDRGFRNVEIVCADGSEGYPSAAPYDRFDDAHGHTEQSRTYDRIIGSASAPQTPTWLTKQLKGDGSIVFPVADGIQRIVAAVDPAATERFTIETYPYFAFVPLVGKRGHRT